MKHMNNRFNKTNTPVIPMNLQFFAEGEGGEGEGAKGGEGNGAEGNGDGNGEGTGKQTFDDILKDTEYQAEFDRRVQKAINTAVSKQKQSWEASLDDKLTEAEKLAKMTKEQKTEYLNQKKEKELSAREAEITKKELMAEAKGTLAEKKLQAGLSAVLDYTSAEACNKSIETVEKAFKEAVEAAVQEQIKGGTTPKRAHGNDNTLEQQILDAMRAQY